MTEYQYYEFLALDRPLTRGQREELRRLSTRAEITATRFANEYNWGDFSGDPAQMTQEVADLIETKKPQDYDLAVALLLDLSALARRDDDHDSFTARFLALRARHERKPSLQARFDTAGLPRQP